MADWKTLIPVIGMALMLIFGGGWLWNVYYAQPDLTYQILPRYQYSGQESVTGILFKNTGHAVAHNVRLEISSVDPFVEIIIEGAHEEYQTLENWENANKAVFSFTRLIAGDDFIAYTSVKTTNPQINVYLASDEVKGHEETPGIRAPIATAVVAIGAIILAFFSSFMISRLQRRTKDLEKRATRSKDLEHHVMYLKNRSKDLEELVMDLEHKLEGAEKVKRAKKGKVVKG